MPHQVSYYTALIHCTIHIKKTAAKKALCSSCSFFGVKSSVSFKTTGMVKNSGYSFLCSVGSIIAVKCITCQTTIPCSWNLSGTSVKGKLINQFRDLVQTLFVQCVINKLTHTFSNDYS